MEGNMLLWQDVDVSNSDAGSYRPHDAMREQAQNQPMCTRSERQEEFLWLQSSYMWENELSLSPSHFCQIFCYVKPERSHYHVFKLNKGILTCCESRAI